MYLFNYDLILTRDELRLEFADLREEIAMGSSIDCLRHLVQDIHFQASLMSLHGRGDKALSAGALAKVTAWAHKWIPAIR